MKIITIMESRFFKKLKIELPYDPDIRLLGVWPKQMKSAYQRDTHTLVFIVALFTIAKIQNQLRFLSTDE
jgi:hypothetical protein